MTGGLPEPGIPAAPQEDCALTELFDRNREWASRKTASDPGFFKRLVGQQKPRYFWIGCADSRVPATEIVDLDPGEMFVHRNVANLANPDDPNFQAALQFAVEALEVDHIIVVGHYGCGGVDAAMAGTEPGGAIGLWLAPLRKLYRNTCASHDASRDGRAVSSEELCRRNVSAQVAALAANPVVLAAWSRGTPLMLHGWVYAIGDGLLEAVQPPVVSAQWLPAGKLE
ncbi:carbonic anhydrase [Sphingobium sp. TKS]|uniref:carbonic anhydrase n=1 Tax=Sphingobium sp. TKS TaxID=1315974 RepID=UPI0007705772|nr:carbonic anhydrase [Sphingobium sp. TKS]AMK21555.1 carbonic anhydrase [Sphingobium sp. TKS]